MATFTKAADILALQTFVNSKTSAPDFDAIRAGVPAFANAQAGVIHQAMVEAGYKVDGWQVIDNAADKASGAAVRAAQA